MIKSNKKSILKSLMTIAFPMIIQGLVFQLQSATNKAFLGNVDDIYISAIGAAQFPFNTTAESLIALCTGITIVVSQLYGMKEKKSITETVKSSIFYNTILALFLGFLWYSFSNVIFSLMSVDSNIVHYSMKYVRICSFYFILLGVDASLQAMLQGMGKTKPIMYAGLVKVLLNIILDWALIFGHFGFPALNIEGAAISTTIANLISSCMVIIYCFVIKKDTFKLREGKLISRKWSLYKGTITLGLPAGAELFLWNASNLVLVKFLNSISYHATTIYTLTFSIEVIVYTVFSSIGKAGLTLEGNRIGMSDKKGAKEILNVSLVLGLVAVAIAILTFTLFPAQILGIFTKDNHTVTSAVPYLIFTAFILLPKSINVIVGSGIRAYGETKWMLYTQIVGSIFVVSCSFILVQIFHVGVVAIFTTIIFDEIIRASLNCYHYYRGNIHNRLDTTLQDVAV